MPRCSLDICGVTNHNRLRMLHYIIATVFYQLSSMRHTSANLKDKCHYNIYAYACVTQSYMADAFFTHRNERICTDPYAATSAHVMHSKQLDATSET